MTFEEFHQFLIDNSGVTVRLVSNLFIDRPSPIKSFFFKQYKSIADPFFRTSSLVTDPLVLTYLALEFILIAALYVIKSLVDLTMWEPWKAKDSLGNSVAFLVAASIQIFAAITAPIINAVDLMGSGINLMSGLKSEV
jgi:hypothetical protein